MLAMTLHSREVSPRRALPSGQERDCYSLSARDAASRAGLQSTNAMGAVFKYMAHHADQIWDKEVRHHS